MTFVRSEGTVGVEYELQLVDVGTLDLVDGILRVLQALADPAHVVAEFIQSTIEVTTPVCEDIAGVDASLRATLRRVAAACEPLGMRLCAAGTHPFCRRLAVVTPVQRYEEMAARSGIIGQTQITHALQVHVGVGSGEQAVAAMRDLRGFMPLLLALSASSPFWYGYDTEFASWRHRILAADRTYGMPPRFGEWEEVVAMLAAAVRGRVVRGWRDIHWDVRPRPDYGTIEVRIMDTVPTVTEATALAAFVRALVVYLIRTPPRERPELLPRTLPPWLENENNFQASRLALDAQFVAGANGAPVHTLRDVAAVAVDAVAPVAQELGDADYLAQVRPWLIANPSHARQRQVRLRTGSTKDVVGELADELRADLARHPPGAQ